MDPKYKDTIVVSAGETFRLEADVHGKPLPTIKWYKGDKELEETARYEIKNTDFSALIIVKDAVRVDGGQYILEASNVAGTKTVPVNVKVLDRPGPPEGPVQVTGVTAEKCSLAWSPPLHDGGSDISHYIVEKRETSRLAWTIVASEVLPTMLKVTKLLEGNEYIFRIMAVNKYGVGEPLESVPVMMKNPFVVPGPPKALEITNITKDSMTVCWNRPDSDGGSEIIGYIVEKRDRAGIRWIKCNKRRITDLRLRVTGLTEDHEYEFRVSAENAAGVGESSQVSPYFKACDPMFKPGPPTNAHVVDTTKSSITLGWSKPIYDGGCEIQGYLVEICKADEDEWSLVTPQTGVRATRFEIKKLTEHQEYKLRVCALNKIGVGEAASVPGTIKPEDKLEAPELDIDSELRKGIVVRAGGSARIHIPFRGRPTPDITWSREEGEFTEKVQIDKGINYTQLSIDNCDRNDAAKYILKLENSSGSKSAFVTVKVLDTPGPPQNLVVKDIKKDSAVLSWEPPIIDGGAKVKNYVIDKRESTRKAFANVSAKCGKTSFKVENLTEGAIYYFRVMAENEFGVGVPAETTDAVKASEPPLPPGKVTLTDVTQRSASLTWEKPEHDGGSRILGYIVEMLPKGTDKWSVVSETKTCNAVVSGLSPGQEYQFRVIAYNEKGKSDPRALGIPVIAKDLTIEPSFKLMFNTYSVQAGEDLKVEVPFIGRPKPTITWAKDEQPLKQTTRLDGGQYTLNLRNVGGTKSIPITVKVLDRPGPPEGPLKVTGVTAEKCYLAWAPPLHDGGSSISHYIIEKRETSRLSWTQVATDVQALNYKVTRLLAGNEYIFRVMAVNKYGTGEPLESEPIVARNPYKSPGPPSTPEVSAITKDSMVVTWGRPEDDGGAEIEGYILEKRDKDGIRWTKCNKKRLTDLRFRVTGLTDGHFYEFRVSAENAAGVGQPSEPSIFYRACDVLYPPGPPSNPKVTDTSRSSVSLAWSKPIYDGGAPVKGYVVEVKEAAADEWTTCTPPTGLQAKQFTVTKLKENQEYNFRICAINSEGVGEPATIPGTVIAADKIEPPEIELDADLRKVVTVRASGTLRLFVTIKGRPEPEVKWEKAEGTISERAQIEVTSSYTMLVIDNVNRFDSGRYNLTLENNSGKKSAFVNVRVLDTPSAPINLTIREVKKDFVALAWEPPLIDEMQTKGSIKWSACTQVKTLEATITGLSMGEEYSFRVIAVNEKGKSDPRELGIPVIAKDIEIQPSAELLFNTYTVKAGDDLKIDVPFRGRPLPTISWKKDGNALKETTRVNIQTSKTSTSLSIKEASNEDLGHYELHLSNTAGSTTASLTVVVLDRPGPPTDVPPEKLGVTNVTKDSVSLSWLKPEHDGGSRIVSYLIEALEKGQQKWVKCAVVKTTHHVVHGLKENVDYFFRVFAENQAGLSDPKELLLPVTVKEHLGMPSDKRWKLIHVKFDSYLKSKNVF
uniref:Titin n=1 Tax=Athene cunicularia TaxID=194338 RepID=A0A663MB66_ATHCN